MQVMVCNGHNHHDGCTCGWGGEWHGNKPLGSTIYLRANRIHSEKARRTRLSEKEIHFDVDVRALTIPNARCPVCGASAFFYQNDYGSRVFFDSLGPPWPKHPCTDRNRKADAGRSWVEYE